MNTNTRSAASGSRGRPASRRRPQLDAKMYRRLAGAYFTMANMAKDLADAAEWIAELELGTSGLLRRPRRSKRDQMPMSRNMATAETHSHHRRMRRMPNSVRKTSDSLGGDAEASDLQRSGRLELQLRRRLWLRWMAGELRRDGDCWMR